MLHAVLLGLLTSSSLMAQDAAPGELLFPSDGIVYGAIEWEGGFIAARQASRWGDPGPSVLIRLVPTADGQWQETPLFPGETADRYDPAFDPAGNRLCFIQTSVDEAAQGDIWCASPTENGWSDPQPLPAPVNSNAGEWSPAFDASGTLYFASLREGGFGQGDLYRGVETAAGWEVGNLGPRVNSAHGEWNVGISPDGEQLVFETSGRTGNLGRPGDLYTSRREGGEWTPATPVSQLNSSGSDLLARPLHDGGWAFTQAAIGAGNSRIYRVNEQVLAAPSGWLAAVARSSGEVVLLDPATLAEAGRYSVGNGPHEIAASEDGRLAAIPLFGVFPEPHDEPVAQRPPFRSVTSDGLQLLDLHTGEQRRLALPDCVRPHGVAATPQANLFWVTCEQAGTVIEVDPAAGRITRSFGVGIGVHKVIWHPDGDRLVTTNPDTGQVSLIDLGSGQVSQIETGSGAEGITLTPDGNTAFVANAGDRNFCRVNLAEHIIDWCQPVDGVFPIAVAYDAVTDSVWIARLGNADLAIFSGQNGGALGSVPLPSMPLNLAVNTIGRRIYVSLPRDNTVLAVDLDNRTLAGRAEGIMEVDDLDLVPRRYFDAPPDP